MSQQSVPQCRNCHEVRREDNVYHAQHGAEFACQVCHAQDYVNCSDCHEPSRQPSQIWQGFKIGRNPLSSRREEVVVLRHAPVTPEMFEAWNIETYVTFVALPTFQICDTSQHPTLDHAHRANYRYSRLRYTCHNTPDSPEGWFLRWSNLANLSTAEQTANDDFFDLAVCSAAILRLKMSTLQNEKCFAKP